ncbi:precorrin-2 dehydrogenase/sirohydrochlorin ferrochelatase family protein [Clostridium sp. ZS2-4]|uniref:precorrin-2 dehydrogenase/sirohydrochlorin ferrochelatase family protein n=1 Tax=Clostridium sp. ZS2-4 TaxID=2987703 RepID=UPI00227D1058|nr:bifunctional precorrin-2 dehydrogenase/sirohydrochlorin ferrochelatase [Clostridium sp. ZS2-4]MCY6354156.1 bifunctional precorrin-2 dehydrogenase/sirohydrochlorin ferrochelatase [Clostridium sp. ZS2-4]
MKKYYPIMLDIENKNCLVIGGGRIAYRKTLSLLECGGKVKVLSKNISDEFKILINKGEIEYIEDNYSIKYIDNVYIVYAATDNRSMNKTIYEDCNRNNILVNVVDEPDICNFIVPAKVQRGDLTVAVSTNGKSPMLSRRIREELEKVFNSNYEDFLDIMGDMRSNVLREIKDGKKRREFFKEVVYSDFIERLTYENKEEVQQEIYGIFEKYKNQD